MEFGIPLSRSYLQEGMGVIFFTRLGSMNGPTSSFSCFRTSVDSTVITGAGSRANQETGAASAGSHEGLESDIFPHPNRRESGVLPSRLRARKVETFPEIREPRLHTTYQAEFHN